MDESVKKSLQDIDVYPLSSDNIATGQRIPLCLGMVGVIFENSEIKEGGGEYAESFAEFGAEEGI